MAVKILAVLLAVALFLPHQALSGNSCGSSAAKYPFSVVIKNGQINRLPNPIAPLNNQLYVPHCYPWMAYLTRSDKPNDVLCGGALVSDKWVLTAASCFNDDASSPNSVTLGAHGIPEIGEPKADTVAIKTVVKHPQYNSETKANNFALAELQTPVSLRDEIRPICLPEADQSFQEYSGKTLLSGWINDSNEPKVVHEYILEVQGCSSDSNSVCTKALNNAQMLGAGWPLMVPTGGAQLAVVGVQSSTDALNAGGSGPKFAHVPAARAWIGEVTGL